MDGRKDRAVEYITLTKNQMKTEQLKHFQTDGETWERRAEKGKLPAVIDPADLKGRKNFK